MARPVLITTDLDRTLLFSCRAIAQLGGALPADPVETLAGATSPGTGGELAHAARDCLRALPQHARLCVATSRSVSRLARLRLPFPVPYAIASNGGVVLIDGVLDPGWEARVKRLLAAAAPAEVVREVLAGSDRPGGSRTVGEAAAPWLVRMGDSDDMCCMAIVELALLEREEYTAIADRCGELGWEASLVGRKLYAFPAGFGKEHAAAYVAERMAALAGAAPHRLAAGDTEHDRLMLTDADLAWVPAGSELAVASPDPVFVVTDQPGHAAAAQITRQWLRYCRTR
jgi:hydroxymethylpyrimidine pyrophosphatase-like HAD family hydrolase